MDVNTLRIGVTLASLALFVALMLHTWSRRRQAEHDAAAMLPFLADEADDAVPATGRHATPRTKE